MKTYKLSRKKAHRTSLVKNLATSLIVYERITTTEAKAKATQRFVEGLMGRVQVQDKLNGYRYALGQLHTQKAAQKVIEVLKERFANRPGGFTRLLKLGNRRGDNAPTAILELTVKTEEEMAGKVNRGEAGNVKTEKQKDGPDASSKEANKEVGIPTSKIIGKKTKNEKAKVKTTARKAAKK